MTAASRDQYSLSASMAAISGMDPETTDAITATRETAAAAGIMNTPSALTQSRPAPEVVTAMVLDTTAYPTQR